MSSQIVATPQSGHDAAAAIGPLLFQSLKIRDLVLPNRIVVSPMCQYSATDGVPNDWHFVHLGSRAVGGAGLVIVEASGVEARGRISAGDLGIYNDEQVAAFKRIVDFIHSLGSKAGIQIAHAGRKASTQRPWVGSASVPVGDPEGWQTVAPSAIPFRPEDTVPQELTVAEIREIVAAFGKSAARALEAGFDVIEIHAAHGYLLNQFLSPLSNHRTDEYGGSFENRTRIVEEVVKAMRAEWPESHPLFIRFSVTDWAEGGWDLEQTVQLTKKLKSLGVDLVDASSGGLVPHAKIPVGPGYQVPLAEGVKKGAEILTGAVGLITEAGQAEEILQKGQADVVLLARELLRDPYWPIHAARKLGADIKVPNQYLRAV